MKLVITIDTEEDDWGGYNQIRHGLENIRRIPSLQRLFDDFHAKPTYLITYPVATDEESVATLRGFLEQGRCEIGSHCHPWNTPPYEEQQTEINSMLCNLPADLQYRKISQLHGAIKKNFDIEPACFRSGRWGFNQSVARNLSKLGYTIDTSISPYTDWTDNHGPDFSAISPKSFRFSIDETSTNGRLIEIPATIGFLQRDFALSNAVLRTVTRKPLRRFRLGGILFRLHLVNKVWLSPETSDANTMIKLAKMMKRKNFPIINLFFHSPSLKAGLTPFVKTENDEKRFFHHLQEFLLYARDNGIESMTLSDALNSVSHTV